MSLKGNPLGLGCPLIQRLRELGGEAGGRDPAFAAALLGLLGAFQKDGTHPDLENIRALVNGWSARGGKAASTELKCFCGPCEWAYDCLVGEVILDE